MSNYLIAILGMKTNKISKQEIILLEILIYNHIMTALNTYFHMENNIFGIKEDSMLSGELIRRLANDLLVNEEYSIAGLAQYTSFPEEVIYELVSGINNNPTITLANKIIELHIFARRELYMSFLKDAIKMGQLSFL